MYFDYEVKIPDSRHGITRKKIRGITYIYYQIMKSHKYWSLGALFCMLGCIYSGIKKSMTAHKYFAYSSLLCMGMTIYSGHKLVSPKKKKSLNQTIVRIVKQKIELYSSKTRGISHLVQQPLLIVLLVKSAKF